MLSYAPLQRKFPFHFFFFRAGNFSTLPARLAGGQKNLSTALKITTDFPLKIEFTCFSMGLTHNFHGKKGGPEFFFSV